MAESDRARKPGGGRKKITVNDLTLLADLDTLVDAETGGGLAGERPFSARSEQMEQNSAQAFQFYHDELARVPTGVS